MLASGVGNARLHLDVMPVSEQALPDLEGICILAELLLDLRGDVICGLAVLTEIGGALQPNGVTDTLCPARVPALGTHCVGRHRR